MGPGQGRTGDAFHSSVLLETFKCIGRAEATGRVRCTWSLKAEKQNGRSQAGKRLQVHQERGRTRKPPFTECGTSRSSELAPSAGEDYGNGPKIRAGRANVEQRRRLMKGVGVMKRVQKQKRWVATC